MPFEPRLFRPRPRPRPRRRLRVRRTLGSVGVVGQDDRV